MEAIYEKPAMKFVELYSREAVADGNCWSKASGGKGEGKIWYYDTPGPGYIEFKINGNCSGNERDLGEHEGHNYVTELEKNEAIEELEKLLKTDQKTNSTGNGIYEDIGSISS